MAADRERGKSGGHDGTRSDGDGFGPGGKYEIQDAELLEVADDSEQAHQLHQALRQLARSPSVGAPLQRMAKDVLSGRIGMRDVVQSEEYLGALGDKLSQMKTAAEKLTPEQREQSLARAEVLRETEQERRAAESAGLESGRGPIGNDGREGSPGSKGTGQPQGRGY